MIGDRRTVVLAWVGLALLLVSRVHLLSVRILDPDEFEHLHASYCIARRMVPYRDYFEHHGPLTYYLAVPLNLAFGPDPLLLLANRCLSLLLVTGTLCAVWCTVSRVSGSNGRWNALLACGWLVTLPCFAEKSLEWRPDVPAMFFLAWAAYLLSVRTFAGRFFLAGLLLGLATLCTQKVAFLCVGMTAGLLFHCPRRGKLAALGALVGGAVIPWSVTIAYFWIAGGLDDLIRCMVLYPLRWPHDPQGEATPLVSLWRMMSRTQFAPGHYGLFAYAALALPVSFWKRGDRRLGPVVFGVCAHFLALPLVPAVYLQHYLLAAPLAAVMVGSIGVFSGREEETEQRTRALVPLGSLIFAISFFVFGVWLQWTHLRPFFDGFPNWQRIVYSNLDAICLTLLPVGTLVWLVLRQKGAVILWLVLLLPGIGRAVIPHWYWPTNRSQFEELAVIDKAVAPDEKVLDGFSGLGCLRPHAYYYWWINQHSIPLMKQERALEPLRQIILAGEPALIILDPNLDHLREFLGPAITARYQTWRPLRKDLYLLIRKDKL